MTDMVRASIADFGPRPELSWLPVKMLSVDPAYQRSLESRASQTSIKSIAENFRWSCFGTVLCVSTVDGWLIIDGQHRVKAAEVLGIDRVPCIVVSEISVAEQAQIFLTTNQVRVRVHALALFHARAVAKDAAALAALELCAAAGLSIPRSPRVRKDLKPGETLASKLIEQAATQEIQRHAVIACAQGCEGKRGAVTELTLQAAISVAVRHPDRLADITSWFSKQDPDQITRLQFPTAWDLAERIIAETGVTASPNVSRLPPPIGADPLSHVVKWMTEIGEEVSRSGSVYVLNGRQHLPVADFLEAVNRRRKARNLKPFALPAVA